MKKGGFSVSPVTLKTHSISAVFFESATNQKLRVERLNRNLKVSISGKVSLNQNTENAGQGKVGIFLRNNGGNLDDGSGSIDIYIKKFQILELKNVVYHAAQS